MTLAENGALQDGQVRCDQTQRKVRCDVSNLYSEMFALQMASAVVALVIVHVLCVFTVAHLVSSQIISDVPTNFSFFSSKNANEEGCITIVVIVVVAMYYNQVQGYNYCSFACHLFVCVLYLCIIEMMMIITCNALSYQSPFMLEEV